MSDLERELALRLAENEGKTYRALAATAWEEANKAVARAKDFDRQAHEAEMRHDRIADGGPVEDET